MLNFLYILGLKKNVVKEPGMTLHSIASNWGCFWLCFTTVFMNESGLDGPHFPYESHLF